MYDVYFSSLHILCDICVYTIFTHHIDVSSSQIEKSLTSKIKAKIYVDNAYVPNLRLYWKWVVPLNPYLHLASTAHNLKEIIPSSLPEKQLAAGDSKETWHRKALVLWQPWGALQEGVRIPDDQVACIGWSDVENISEEPISINCGDFWSGTMLR